MSYQPLNNVTTTDAYTEANTLWCFGAERVNFDVSNAAIFRQFGIGIRPDVQWESELFLGPTFRSYDRKADAVRIRSAVAGTPAQVTVEAVPGDYIP